jgi:hypothetical protein
VASSDLTPTLSFCQRHPFGTGEGVNMRIESIEVHTLEEHITNKKYNIGRRSTNNEIKYRLAFSNASLVST